ncbi:MAG: hypothetical protein EWM50_02900 [Gottschalkiaceae bacterium]|nr:MAG: hypothetical protein EWM50_02900 [Gottschalkiaceae bacterium]
MNHRIRGIQLYDSRLYKYDGSLNNYKDVYIDIELNGEILNNIRVGDLIDNKCLELTNYENEVILRAAKKLVKDPVYNFYIYDFATKKIISKQYFDY